MTRVELLLNKLNNDSTRLDIKLRRPAKPSRLKELEAILKHRLPEDFKTFYLLSNGFDTTDLLFQLLPIETIIQETSRKEMVFADYMIYSDTWKIIHNPTDPDNYKIVNANHDTDETVVLSDSLFDFIERYLDNGLFGEKGLYTWYEEQKELQFGNKSS